MSRRTKFIIAAIFLVLLAIPAAYLALIWDPPPPLRIRIAPAAGHAPATKWTYKGYTLPVVVENTSLATVHLSPNLWALPGNVHSDRMHGLVMDVPKFKEFKRGSIVIPPHGTASVELWVETDLLKSVEQGATISVLYGWVSDAKIRSMEYSLWLASRLPASWSEYVLIRRCQENYDIEYMAVPRGAATTYGISPAP